MPALGSAGSCSWTESVWQSAWRLTSAVPSLHRLPSREALAGVRDQSGHKPGQQWQV